MASKIPNTYEGLKTYHENMVAEATKQINDLRKKASTAEEAQKKAEAEVAQLREELKAAQAAVDPKVVEATKAKIAEAEKVTAQARESVARAKALTDEAAKIKAEAEAKVKAAEQKVTDLQKRVEELEAAAAAKQPAVQGGKYDLGMVGLLPNLQADLVKSNLFEMVRLERDSADKMEIAAAMQRMLAGIH